MSHSSYTSSSNLVGEQADRAHANKVRVAEVIRQFGTDNPQFPADKDITFAEIREHFDVGGLGTILKNMKRENLVDYRDPFIKDDTVVTLVQDYYQAFNPQGITYEEICQKSAGDDSGHMRSVAAEAGAA